MHPLDTLNEEPEKTSVYPGCALACCGLLGFLLLLVTLSTITAAFWWGLVGKMFEN